MDRDRFAAYLNDHLAGSIAARELAERRRKDPRLPEVEEFLDRFVPEVEEDRATLRRAMTAAGAEAQVWKELAALGAAWLEALRPRVSSNSPQLVRDVEILILGVRGRRLLWTALQQLSDSALDPEELQRLVARADRQLEELHGLHERAVALELEGEPVTAS